MKSKLVNVTTSVLTVFFLALAAAVQAPAQEHWSGPIVTHAVHFDVSPPLRDMIGVEQPPGPPQIIPLRHRTPPQAVPSGQEDAALQESVGPLVGTTNGLNFDGVGANGSAPPDSSLHMEARNSAAHTLHLRRRISFTHVGGLIAPWIPCSQRDVRLRANGYA